MAEAPASPKPLDPEGEAASSSDLFLLWPERKEVESSTLTRWLCLGYIELLHLLSTLNARPEAWLARGLSPLVLRLVYVAAGLPLALDYLHFAVGRHAAVAIAIIVLIARVDVAVLGGCVSQCVLRGWEFLQLRAWAMNSTLTGFGPALQWLYDSQAAGIAMRVVLLSLLAHADASVLVYGEYEARRRGLERILPQRLLSRSLAVGLLTNALSDYVTFVIGPLMGLWRESARVTGWGYGLLHLVFVLSVFSEEEAQRRLARSKRQQAPGGGGGGGGNA